MCDIRKVTFDELMEMFNENSETEFKEYLKDIVGMDLCDRMRCIKGLKRLSHGNKTRKLNNCDSKRNIKNESSIKMEPGIQRINQGINEIVRETKKLDSYLHEFGKYDGKLRSILKGIKHKVLDDFKGKMHQLKGQRKKMNTKIKDMTAMVNHPEMVTLKDRMDYYDFKNPFSPLKSDTFKYLLRIDIDLNGCIDYRFNRQNITGKSRDNYMKSDNLSGSDSNVDLADDINMEDLFPNFTKQINNNINNNNNNNNRRNKKKIGNKNSHNNLNALNNNIYNDDEYIMDDSYYDSINILNSNNTHSTNNSNDSRNKHKKKRKKKSKTKSKSRNGGSKKTTKTRKRKPKRKQRPNIDKNDQSNWSKAKMAAFLAKGSNPNKYYYRFNESDDDTSVGSEWTDDQIRQFMERVKEMGVNKRWGEFSRTINGKVGYACSNFWRTLIKEKMVKDYTYYFDNNGKPKQIKQKQINFKISDEFKKYGFVILQDLPGPYKADDTHELRPNNADEIIRKLSDFHDIDDDGLYTSSSEADSSSNDVSSDDNELVCNPNKKRRIE